MNFIIYLAHWLLPTATVNLYSVELFNWVNCVFNRTSWASAQNLRLRLAAEQLEINSIDESEWKQGKKGTTGFSNFKVLLVQTCQLLDTLHPNQGQDGEIHSFLEIDLSFKESYLSNVPTTTTELGVWIPVWLVVKGTKEKLSFHLGVSSLEQTWFRDDGCDIYLDRKTRVELYKRNGMGQILLVFGHSAPLVCHHPLCNTRNQDVFLLTLYS